MPRSPLRTGSQTPFGRLGAATAVLVVLAAACTTPAAPPEARRLEVADVLGGANLGGFERALEPREFVFPADHGAHPSFASEWWYFTGNLESAEGRRFGYQLTFFRNSLQPPATSPARTSDWAAQQVWMAHFAVTDVGSRRFVAFDRFQRGALGLAGAQATPWRVWLDDWSLEQLGDAPFPLRLRAREGTADGGDGGDVVTVDLTIDAVKPIVLQGDRGLSRKGATPGNASYYYSFTRLSAEGTVRVGDAEHEVAGSSWLDREWSTSALEEGQVGWDWFALQLDDGSELMYYQLRENDGSPSPQSAGTVVRADGVSAPLAPGSVLLSVERTWNSSLDGATYPSRWTLSIPERGVLLSISPVFEDQELDLAFRYWEGAVDVTGIGLEGTEVSGRGYVELTGYAGAGLHP